MSAPRVLPALVAGVLAITACGEGPVAPGEAAQQRYNSDWTTASHGKSAPNYEVVFPAKVNTIEIVMTAAQWAAVRADMRTIWGFDFGAGASAPNGPFPTTEPSYIDVTVRANGKQWKHVGFRLKGNSSLQASWRAGIYKLPFRLDFDEHEKAYPGIDDQRFYGFKQLSMSPGWSDNSLIREKLMADVLRDAGVPAARAAFYRVFIDFGAGLQYCGVYTAVEVVENTMIRTQFGDGDRNIYKPTSRLNAFVASEFEKKNNETAADYSDVRAFITALNAPTRTSDPAAWRAALEATFDVDHFLRWLAVSNAVVNWDSYGAMPHNYYLYAHPTRRLTWIPWDHNMSMTGNPGITGVTGPNTVPRTGRSLTMNEVSSAWPLIRYLVDDPVYFARYKAHLATFLAGAMSPARLDALADQYHTLIGPYVVGPGGEQPAYTHLQSPTAFTSALTQLRSHFEARRALVGEFVR